MASGQFRAQELSELLARHIFDADDAADFLGIKRNSLEYAAYRKRIPYVQYGAKKLFTRQDLEEYAARRGKGRYSQLEEVDPVEVK